MSPSATGPATSADSPADSPAGSPAGTGAARRPSGAAAVVLAVHAAADAPPVGFAKPAREVVRLEVAHGVTGDRHGGRALRQVHLVDAARYSALQASGADVGPGHLGENVTTTGVDLLGLTRGALLRLGATARVRLTGVRFPRHEDPATDRVGLSLDEDGVPVGRVGVFAVVEVGGEVRPGDPVLVEQPGDGEPLHPL